MTFNELKRLLLYTERTIEYKSLTSDKTHTLKCTIKRDFQKDSSKILVWDIVNECTVDIEVSTVMSVSQ